MMAHPLKHEAPPRRQYLRIAHFILVFLISLQLSSAQATALIQVAQWSTLASASLFGAAQSDVRRLELGKPIERELAGGQTHIYQLALTSGQYLNLVADQRGTDVVVTLFGPDGKQIIEVEGPTVTQGPKLASVIAEVTGSHRLEIRPRLKDAAAGRYEIKITELRTATAEDRALVEAFRLHNESVSLRIKGKNDEAIPLAERALAAREKALGSEHIDVAASLNNLAILFYQKEDYGKAEPLYQRALAIREKMLGPEHPDVLTSLNNLANLYNSKGDYGKAEPLYERILAIREKTLGSKHPDVAASLNDLANLYYNKGNFGKAEEVSQRALTMWKALANGQMEAEALTIIALSHERTDDRRKAIDYYNQALPLWRALANREREASTLTGIAFNYDRLGERRRALDYYSQVLPLWRALGNRESEAVILNNIGLTYNRLGENQKALDYFNQILSLDLGAGNSLFEGNTLNNIGGAYKDMGDWQKALEFYQRALPLLQAAKDRGREANVLNNIGTVYNQLGEKQQALQYYEQALALWRAVGAKNAEGIALNNLGAAYDNLGEKQKALDSFDQALAVLRSIGDRATEGKTLNNMGLVYADLGDSQRALGFYAQSLALRRAVEDRAGEAVTLDNIGNIYYKQGDKKKALECYEQSLPLRRAVGDKFGEAVTLNNLGAVYADFGERQKALDQYHQALPLRRTVGDQTGEAATLHNLGFLHAKFGESQKALEYYEQALPMRRAVRDKAGEASTLLELSHIERDQGHLNEARVYSEQALELFEHIRAKVMSQELRASYLATVRNFYDDHVDLLMRMHQQNPSQKYEATALQTIERARARSLVELLAESRADIYQGVDPELIVRERNLQQRVRDKGVILLQFLGKKEKENQARALEKEIDSLTTEFQQVQAKIRSASPRSAAIMQPQPPRLPEIQAQLDKDTLLLEYALGPENSYLWAVTPTSISSYRLPKGPEVEALAKSVSQLLTARQPLPGETPLQRLQRVQAADAAYPEQVRQLSQMVLGPAADQLGTKRLLIVADGALQYIPFAALPKPIAQGHALAHASETGQKLTSEPSPLVVTNEIVILPSVSALAEIRRDLKGRTPAPKSVAVLADPVFSRNDLRVKLDRRDQALGNQSTKNAGETKTPVSSDPAAPAGRAQLSPVPRDALTGALRGIRAADKNDDIPRLPFSRRESEAILLLVRPDDGLQALDFKANRATATSETLRQYRIVHFATHGLLNTERPELSGIILSLVDEKGQPQDGFLQMHEIFNLKLPSELVVLSACQTGLGKENRSEGLMGLTRGFMYAGAARVMASLWQVDDVATAELMKHFYQGILKERRRPAEALRMAQVEMWKQRRWQAPFYWASFVLQGEWK